MGDTCHIATALPPIEVDPEHGIAGFRFEGFDNVSSTTVSGGGKNLPFYRTKEPFVPTLK